MAEPPPPYSSSSTSHHLLPPSQRGKACFSNLPTSIQLRILLAFCTRRYGDEEYVRRLWAIHRSARAVNRALYMRECRCDVVSKVSAANDDDDVLWRIWQCACRFSEVITSQRITVWSDHHTHPIHSHRLSRSARSRRIDRNLYSMRSGNKLFRLENQVSLVSLICEEGRRPCLTDSSRGGWAMI
jgi:hypothetical protein